MNRKKVSTFFVVLAAFFASGFCGNARGMKENKNFIFSYIGFYNPTNNKLTLQEVVLPSNLDPHNEQTLQEVVLPSNLDPQNVKTDNLNNHSEKISDCLKKNPTYLLGHYNAVELLKKLHPNETTLTDDKFEIKLKEPRKKIFDLLKDCEKLFGDVQNETRSLNTLIDFDRHRKALHILTQEYFPDALFPLTTSNEIEENSQLITFFEETKKYGEPAILSKIKAFTDKEKERLKNFPSIDSIEYITRKSPPKLEWRPSSLGLLEKLYPNEVTIIPDKLKIKLKNPRTTTFKLLNDCEKLYEKVQNEQKSLNPFIKFNSLKNCLSLLLLKQNLNVFSPSSWTIWRTWQNVKKNRRLINLFEKTKPHGLEVQKIPLIKELTEKEWREHKIASVLGFIIGTGIGVPLFYYLSKK